MTGIIQPGARRGFSLSARSNERLGGVHKDLTRVVRRALQRSTVDFAVLEGRRTMERQKLLYQSGATRTLNSRHLSGHAVDLGAWVGGAVRWDWPLYEKINQAMQLAAAEMGVPVEWGGDWQSFKDGPHFQLPWSAFPILRQAQDEDVQAGEGRTPHGEFIEPSRNPILRQAQDEDVQAGQGRTPHGEPVEPCLSPTQGKDFIHVPHPEEPPQAASRRVGAPQDKDKI